MWQSCLTAHNLARKMVVGQFEIIQAFQSSDKLAELGE
jgi:hypothetical protein